MCHHHDNPIDNRRTRQTPVRETNHDQWLPAEPAKSRPVWENETRTLCYIAVYRNDLARRQTPQM
jgi:hypothetical protein